MKTMTNISYAALSVFALAGFALLPQARAVCQEGCLTNQNTVLGDDVLTANTDGYNNTGIGYNALFSNTRGFENTANGAFALFSNTTGFDNTANGLGALFSNTTGDYNTAGGVFALFLNSTGTNNTAGGYYALGSNTTGNNNTASGVFALYGNTTGHDNTAIGFNALSRNTTGSKNIALGFKAGFNLTTGDSNIAIGNAGVAGESSTIRIGRAQNQTATFIAGISGATVAGGVGVIIDSTGHLGTIVSSARFKDSIEPMDKASEAILSLKPVRFRYKMALDSKGIPQFGLVAEDVAKVNPDLVVRDEEGKPYTVRYEAVNAMLLNEFLKEHRKVEEQGDRQLKLEATVAQQQKEIAALTAALNSQAAQIQMVSDQLRTQARAPLVVAND